MVMKRFIVFAFLTIAIACGNIWAQNDPQKKESHRFLISYKENGQDKQEQTTNISFFGDEQGNYFWKEANEEGEDFASHALSNIQFIGRINPAIRSANTEDIHTLMKMESSVGSGNAEVIASALQSNPNVEEVYSSDDDAVIIKTANDDTYTVYPVYNDEDVFDYDIDETVESPTLLMSKSPAKASSNGKKVAIFNYFSGLDSRKGQNRMMDNLESLFKRHGYQVDSYNYESFTRANLSKVIMNSDNYDAIIIMSHGFIANAPGVVNEPYIILGEAWDDVGVKEDNEHYKWYRFWNQDHSEYNAAFSVQGLALYNNPRTILFVGSCNSCPDGKKDSHLSDTNYVMFSGKTSLSQAYAAIIFNWMLSNGKTLKSALDEFWDVDETIVSNTPTNNLRLRPNDNSKYIYDKSTVSSIGLLKPKDFVSYQKKSIFADSYKYTIKGTVYFTGKKPEKIWTQIIPIWDNKPVVEEEIKINADGSFSKDLKIGDKFNGVYDLIFGLKKGFSRNEVLASGNHSFVYSSKFKENYAEVLEPYDENEKEVFTVNGVSFNMVKVKGGTFMMGASDNDTEAYDDEKPQHIVTLNSFAIGETEVTEELWKAIMGDIPYWSYGNDYPVTAASWDDCQEFISKLNNLTGRRFRLPTEAEWEYAARGGQKSHGYKYSGSNDIDEVAWYGEPYGNSHSVGLKEANELGLFDMTGNVWEWCHDWWSETYYINSPQNNPAGPSSGTYHVVRGGGWSQDSKNSRVTLRNFSEDERASSLGMRLVLEESQEPNDDSVDIANGLVAYYPFNGNANDESGNVNNGEPTSNVTLTTGVNGDENGAYLFGGYDNPGHIYIPNSESLQFNDAFTFSVYVKPISWLSMSGDFGVRLESGGAQCIFAKDHDRNGIVALLGGNDKKMTVWMSSWGDGNDDWCNLTSENHLTENYLNKWTHIAFVCSSSWIRMYVDGVLVDIKEVTPDFSRTNSRPLYIGKFSDTWYPFNGIIDEFRIYNRALTPAEIKELARFHE